VTDGKSLDYIDYRDTGPGIEPELIESEVIFEPQFSTKPNGTGLGLAIASEAAERNDLELKAFESEEGAYFRLQPKMERD
jgi:signal transduction histidine kinase